MSANRARHTSRQSAQMLEPLSRRYAALPRSIAARSGGAGLKLQTRFEAEPAFEKETTVVGGFETSLFLGGGGAFILAASSLRIWALGGDGSRIGLADVRNHYVGGSASSPSGFISPNFSWNGRAGIRTKRPTLTDAISPRATAS